MSKVEIEAWIASRPPKVRAIAEKYPPTQCYTSKKPKGHYWIYSYEENGKKAVTVKVIHGTDSFLPGVTVFGFRPHNLIPCNCKEWKPVNRLQLQMTKDDIERHKNRGGRAEMSGADNSHEFTLISCGKCGRNVITVYNAKDILVSVRHSDDFTHTLTITRRAPCLDRAIQSIKSG